MVCVEDVGMGGDGWIEGWMSGRETERGDRWMQWGESERRWRDGVRGVVRAEEWSKRCGRRDR